MMELDAIPVFVKVAQLGSFTQAAKALAMPNTTVSAKVAQLERALGVTLIQRTTRKLSLTEAGHLYLARAVKALNELETAQSELHENTNELQGVLKLTAAVDIGQSLLPLVVERYRELHPRVKIQLIVTNRVVDLIGEGVDLAIRAGKLKDSTLVAKKFIAGRFGFWASKGFLKKHGVPKDFADLARFSVLHFTPLKDVPIEFTNGKQRVKYSSFESSIWVDDFGSMKALAKRGLGIALMPDLFCELEPSETRLTKVLGDWTHETGQFAIVYPSQEFVSAKVRAFIDVAAEIFRHY